MEQLLLCGKDGWKVLWRREECGGGQLWMAGTQDGSAHCPPQPAFVTAAQHQTRSRQPMLYSGHWSRLHSRQLAHVTLQAMGREMVASPALTHFTLRGGLTSS